MHRASLRNIVISSIIVCLAFLAWPVSSRTSPQKPPQPNFADKLIVDVPVDSLVVQAVTDTRVENVQIPKYARQLDGHYIRMHGIMYPPFEEKGLTQFFFVPETKRRSIHWMSSNIPLHALIAVTTTAGHTENYEKRPFTIEGIFTIEIHSDGGQIHYVYHIRNAKIVEKNIHLRFKPAVAMFGC